MTQKNTTCHDIADPELQDTDVMSVAQCGLSRIEILTLRVMRYFCLTHANPKGQSWRQAMQESIFHLGADWGPKLALATSDCLDALRSERVEPFNFIDPDCPQCTDRIFAVEWGVIATLRGLRTHEHLLVDATLASILHMDWGATRSAARKLADLVQQLDIDPAETIPQPQSTTVH